MNAEVSAERYLERLGALCSPDDRAKIQRYFGLAKRDHPDVFLAVRKGLIFGLAKEFIDMPLGEIQRLLDCPVYELRVGALKIMGVQAAHKKTSAGRKKELYDLYLRNTDNINDWGLVDTSGHYVVGGYLEDKPRDILYELARSENWWERRLAMFSTLHFVKKGDLDDTFRLAEILLDDDHDKIHTVVGWLVREAGKHDRERLLEFLDKHAATVPRILLRYAVEHLDKEQRAYYMNLKTTGG